MEREGLCEFPVWEDIVPDQNRQQDHKNIQDQNRQQDHKNRQSVPNEETKCGNILILSKTKTWAFQVQTTRQYKQNPIPTVQD